jgi:L-ascorbate oxidase
MRPCNNKTSKMKCEYNWTIEWYSVLSKACLDCPFNRKNCDQPHCVAGNGVPRPIVTINRMLPGPAIHVCQGDLVQVYLYSSLHFHEATSIHWHGLLQRGSPYMDGLAFIDMN